MFAVRNFEVAKFSKITVCLQSNLLEFANYIAHYKIKKMSKESALISVEFQ